MKKPADVIIIGAGVIGCSIAYHLAKNGCRDVVVLEKDYIGSGSTSKCAGVIRQQFSTEVNIRLSMESVNFFEYFEAETGHPADFRQNGYLMLATTEEEVETFRRNVTLQQSLGLEVYLLSPPEIKKIVPQLNVVDVLGATYCPTDGFADPYSVVQGFARAATKLGVKIYQETEASSIRRSGQVWQVVAKDNKFETPNLVIAAGAYTGLVGRVIGIDIPVHPVRRHIFITSPVDQISKTAPMIVDFHTGFWFRREGAGLIFGMRNPDEAEGFDTSVDWGFLPAIGRVACRWLPFLENTGVIRGQAGLHDDTPDVSAILGAVPEADGLYLACGFSGHGFMHSPAVGRVMAELILKGKPDLDISPLSLQRFKVSVRDRERCFI